MAGYETSGAKDYYPLNKLAELFEVLPCALCTDGIDQRLFLFGGAVQLLYLGNDGIRMSLRNTLLQLSGIRGLMDHDIESVYRFFHRSTPLLRRVCVALTHHAAPPPIAEKAGRAACAAAMRHEFSTRNIITNA